MRILKWLVIPAGAVLVGCASMPNPAAVAPNHPANPNASAAQVAESTSPLTADLAAAKDQPKPRTMSALHMHGGMKMKNMKMGGKQCGMQCNKQCRMQSGKHMKNMHMGGMQHMGTKRKTHQAGEDQ